MSRSVKVSDNPLDPWFDFWTARVLDASGDVLGRWRVPAAPPYTLRYDAKGPTTLDRIEFLDYDGVVRATWDCEQQTIGLGQYYTIEIGSYHVDRTR